MARQENRLSAANPLFDHFRIERHIVSWIKATYSVTGATEFDVTDAQVLQGICQLAREAISIRRAKKDCRGNISFAFNFKNEDNVRAREILDRLCKLLTLEIHVEFEFAASTGRLAESRVSEYVFKGEEYENNLFIVEINGYFYKSMRLKKELFIDIEDFWQAMDRTAKKIGEDRSIFCEAMDYLFRFSTNFMGPAGNENI